MANLQYEINFSLDEARSQIKELRNELSKIPKAVEDNAENGLKKSLDTIVEGYSEAVSELEKKASDSNAELTSAQSAILQKDETGVNNTTFFGSAVTESLGAVRKYVSQIQKLDTKVKDVFTAPLSNLAGLVTDFNKMFQKAEENGGNVSNLKYNQMLTRVASIRAASSYLDTALDAYTGGSSATTQDENIIKNMPMIQSLAQRILEDSSKNYRGRMTFGYGKRLVGGNERFSRFIEKITGSQKNVDELEQISALALASNLNTRRYFSDSFRHFDIARFMRGPSYLNNLDALPDSMAEVYEHNGERKGMASQGKSRADDDVYERLLKLGDYGRNHRFIDLAQRSGLVRINHGRMQWREHATMDQINNLAAETAAELHDVRYGSPLYPRDPENNQSYSKAIQELLEITEILGTQRGLHAGKIAIGKSNSTGNWIKRNNGANIIKTARNPEMYIIPQVDMDSRGELVYSDPAEAARTAERTRKGLQALEEDKFITINESPFAYKLGFTGNNSYGRGFKNGRAVYENPYVVKVKTNDLLKTDEWGFPDQNAPKGEPTSRMEQLAEIINKGTTYGQNGQELTFGWLGGSGDGVFMMDKKKREELDALAREQGLPSMFEAFNHRWDRNISGLIVNGNFEKTTKQINNARKGATPGIRLTELGYKDPEIATWDMGLMDDFFSHITGYNVEKRDELDGVAFIDPKSAPFSFQGRLFAGAAKFMAQQMSLSSLIKKSKAINDSILNDPNMKLITRRANATKDQIPFEYWVPTLAMNNMSEKELDRLMSEAGVGWYDFSKDENKAIRERIEKYGLFNTIMEGLTGRYRMESGNTVSVTGANDPRAKKEGFLELTDEQANVIKNAYMHEVMGFQGLTLTDSAVKNIDQFRVLSPENYAEMFLKGRTDAEKSAYLKTRRTKGPNGDYIIPLTEPEAKEYRRRAAEFTGGTWVKQSADDFVTEKDYMPITVADAINATPSMIRKSREIFDRKIAELDDPVKATEFLMSNPAYAAKLRADKRWLESDEARSAIEEQRNTLKRNRDDKSKIALEQESVNALATVFPGEVVERSFDAYGLTPDENSSVAPLFPQFIKNYLSQDLLNSMPKDDRIIKRYGKDILNPERYMYAPGYKGKVAVGGRMPAAPGTFEQLINLAFSEGEQQNNPFVKAYKAIGAYDMSQISLAPRGIYRMNTGDFDGDTIWLYSVLADDMLESLEKINVPINKIREKQRRIASYTNKHEPEELKAAKNVRDFGKNAEENNAGQMIVGASIGATLAQLVMGEGAAGIRNLVAYADVNNLSDEDAAALQELVEYYDRGTSEVLNKGEESEFSKTAAGIRAKQFVLAGRTYRRLMQQIGQEETGEDGKHHIDSLFKYRGPSRNNLFDLTNAELLGVTRKKTGDDAGIRESLLKSVDRNFEKGTVMHEAQEAMANFIADTETGYRIWEVSDFEETFGDYANKLQREKALKADRGELSESEAKRYDSAISGIQQSVIRFGQTGITAEAVREMMNSQDETTRNRGITLWNNQADDIEKAHHEEYLKGLEERREEARKLYEHQKEIERQARLSPEQLGLIQDTSDLDKFRTSYSVTSVEPWMNGRSAAERLKNYVGWVNVTDLSDDPYAARTSDRFEAPKFGDKSDIIKREADELRNLSVNTPDTLLGTFMHEGIQEYIKNNAEAISLAGESGQPYKLKLGELTQYYRDAIKSNVWRSRFGAKEIGIDVDDIEKAFTTGKFGTSILAQSAQYRDKVRDIFGIGLDDTINWTNIEGGNPNVPVGVPEFLLASFFGNEAGNQHLAKRSAEYVSGQFRMGKRNQMKRIIMMEDTLFRYNDDGTLDTENTGKIQNLDLRPVEVKNLGGIMKYLHAKPDFLYENMEGKYNILDFKSSESGSISALYQNMLYVKMLEDIARASRTGFWDAEKTHAVIDRDVLKPIEEAFLDENGISKFEGGLIESFDLSGMKRLSIDYNSNAINDVWDEYMKGVEAKAADLRAGYIDGKKYLQEIGYIKNFSGAENEKIRQDAMSEGRKWFEGLDINSEAYEKRRAERDFLVKEFERQESEFPEIMSQLYKYAREYDIFPEYGVNKFSSLKEKLKGPVDTKMLSAIASMYEGSPEITGKIADFLKGKTDAENLYDEIIHSAAVLDPMKATETITGIVRGTGSSSALKTSATVRKIVKDAERTRESLKDDKVFKEGQGEAGWLTTDEYWGIQSQESIDAITDEGKKKAAQAERDEKLANKQRAIMRMSDYKASGIELEKLNARYNELIPEIYQNERSSDLDKLTALTKGDDPFTNVKLAYRKKEQELADFIVEEKAKVAQMQADLEAETKGKLKIDNPIERAEIQRSIDETNRIIEEAQRSSANELSLEDTIGESLGLYSRGRGKGADKEKRVRKQQEYIDNKTNRLNKRLQYLADERLMRKYEEREDEDIGYDDYGNPITKADYDKARTRVERYKRDADFEAQDISIDDTMLKREQFKNSIELQNRVDKLDKATTIASMLGTPLSRNDLIEKETLRRIRERERYIDDNRGKEGFDEIAFRNAYTNESISADVLKDVNRETEMVRMQQKLRAEQLASQTSGMINTFDFNQNRVDFMAQRAADQMLINLMSGNASDQSLINANLTRLQQIGHLDASGTWIANNDAVRDELDEYIKQNAEAEERIKDRKKREQESANYRERMRRYYQRADDLQSTRRQDNIDSLMTRGDQIERRRNGFQYTIPGRILDMRDQYLNEARSYRQSIEQQISENVNKLDQFTTSDGTLKTDLSEKEKTQAEQLQKNITRLTGELTQAQQAEQQLAGTGGLVTASFNKIGQAAQRLGQRLGRQIFQKALQEARRFVQEFDASMNEIQAITLKSNDEMGAVRSQTIDKALGLRTSVSNVAQTEAALYRQGLNDEEVATRTDAIIKFATVTKLNVTEATKIITTALQNDLVPSAEQAMDALVALGDSAATTAAEIGKGMQKAAASAKVAGVSYAELTALLTIGTSDTQLSGIQVGTALQTVFTRMRAINTTGWTADVNGEKTSVNEAEAALKSVGIDLFEDKNLQKMKSSYQVLLELSRVWQNLSDVQKSIVTNSLAGTRQTNIFSTLMEGMSEDGGKTLEKYLGLAEGSEGITKSKYEIAMQSLSASMQELKSSWDAVVESFTNAGIITGALDLVSNLLQNLADMGNSGLFGKIAIGITAIGGAIAGLATSSGVFALIKAIPALAGLATVIGPFAGILGAIAGIAAGGLLTKGFHDFGSLFDFRSNSEKIEDNKTKGIEKINDSAKYRDNLRKQKSDMVKEVESLGKAYDEASKSGNETAALKASDDLRLGLLRLRDVFPDLSAQIDGTMSSLTGWTNVVKEAGKSLDEFAKKNIYLTNQEAHVRIKNNEQTEFDQFMDARLYGNRDEILRDLKLTDVAPGLFLDEEGNFDPRKIKDNATDKHYAQIFEALWYGDSKPFKNYLKENENALYEALNGPNADWDALEKDYISAMRKYIDRLSTPLDVNSGEGQIKYRGALRDYIDEKLSQHPINGLGGDMYSDELIHNTLARYIESLFYDDKGNKIIEGFTDANGNTIDRWNGDEFNMSIVEDEIWKFFNNWYDNGNFNDKFVENWINNFAKDSDFDYLVKDAQGNTIKGGRFDNRDIALDFARSQGLSSRNVFDQNGNSLFMSPDQAAESLRVQANENKTAANLSTFVSRVQQSTSVEDLENKYANEDETSVLSSVLSANPEMLGTYLMAREGKINFEDFQKIAKNLGIGGKGSDSTLINSVMDYALSHSGFVSDFRTDGIYSKVYESFSRIIGDSADAVLNAIEGGTSDPNVWKTFDRANITQKIKDAMPFSDNIDQVTSYATIALSGSDVEQLENSASRKAELQSYYDYAAAAERYINGTPQSGDYSTIANYDKSFTENQLRTRDMSTQVGANQKVFENAIIQRQNDLYQGFLIASLGEGATLEDLDKQSKFSMRRKYALMQGKRGSKEYNEAILRSFGLTNRELLNLMYPDFEKELQYWQAQMDENGNIILAPGSETNRNPVDLDTYKYSEVELAKARRDMLNGKTRDQIGSDLYDAAYNSGSDIFKNAMQGYTRYRGQAFRETNLQIEDLEKQQRLDEAKSKARTSLANARTYARLYDQQQNESAYLADSVFNALAGGGSRAIPVEDLNKLIAQNPALLKQIEDLGFTVGRYGLGFSGTEENRSTATSALMNLFAGMSSQYQGFSISDLTSRAAFARMAMFGTPGFDSYLQNLINDQELFNQYKRGDMVTGVRSDYVQRLLENADNGIEGLTAADRTEFAIRMLQDMKTGKGTEYTDAMKALFSQGFDVNDWNAVQAGDYGAGYDRLMENLLLQQSSLGTDTVGGAFAYANRQYMQNNKGAIAADKVLGVLNQIDPNSATALKDLTKSFTSSDASSWAEFIKSSGDLTRKLSDMGVKISDEGIDFDSLNTESYSLADVFAVLRSAAQEASGALSGFKEVLSTGESVERAQAYLNGSYTDENRDAFVSYIGNQNLAQTAINEVKNWNDQYGAQQTAYNEFSAMNTLEKQQYLMSHGGVAPTAPPPLDLTQTLSNYEGINGIYAQMLLRGAAVGQQGITDIDRYNGLSMIETEARQGKLAATWGSDRFGAYNDFTSGIQDSQTWLNAQKTLETSEKLTKLNGNKPVTMFDLKNLKEGTTLYKEVEKSLKPYYSSMKNATDATGDFEKGLLDAKDRALKPFGKETDEIVAKRAKFRGTIKEQNQALKDFRKTQASIMNNQYMRNAFRNGKNVKGLDDYIESLGFDKADAKSKEMRDKILEAMDLDELADESLYQDEISAAFGSMQKAFNDYVNNNEIIVDGVRVGVEDGTVTVNTEALLAQFGSALDETQMQLIQEALARGVDIQWDVKWSNGQTSITPRVVGRAAGGGGLGGGRKSNSGGGGGGGGKKETPGETALKAAKHYVGMAQHMANMAEADLYHPDKMNTYSEYLGAVEANLFTLQQLGQVWQDQIGILEGHRGAVEEGTDEWWSLTEAINEYQESLAKLEESMDNVKAKMFEEAKEQYGYAISERQHNLNMLTTDRTFYSRTNDYNKELESIDNLLREYGSLDKSYRDAIAMYKALAKEEYDQNGQSDYWWSIQQEIDSTTEALAELKNTMADLRAEKLTITIERQEVEDKPENNAFSMMDIYKTRFQEREDYEAYEKVMKERRELLSMAIKTNARQVTELEALLGQYEKGSEEWLATRDQIWTVKLDSATKENELVELEVELAETRLAQVTQGYDREVAYMNHANNLYETYSKSYQSVSNYQGYRSALTQEISMFEDLQKSAEKARDAAVAQMAALQKNTPEWYNAREAVYQYEEAIASAYASQMEMKFAVEESLASELIEVYKDRMDVFDQSTKLLENQKKVYDNNNDYGGYIQTLREENKLLAEQTASRREFLAELQSRMSQTTIGTTAWKNLRKEIYDVEQAISSAEVTLDNFANELEKTKIDYYLEKMDRAQSERTHALTMIQYEETKYQNAGELSNYAIMLQKENEVREKSIEALERDLDLLKEELDNVEIGSKQYQRLIDAIKKKEEAIAADSNAMEKNIRLLDETYNKIKQQRKAVEDQVDNEIKKRKQQEKNQLAAQVNLQNQIFNAIKKRYEDSWSLIQKDIQKQKEALNEEKSLLNERLQARKDAMNAEDKYEQLRELENQLALISNDPTRTKDTKELTKKIEDLRKDISWDRAAEETKTATEIIDEQIEAMDEWITINGENLTEMLQDANNFAEEINYVLSGSYEDLVAWMQENNMEFQNSLAETQEQMIQGWETTWKTMHGIVDTYWDQINEILTSKDNFIKFMQESVDYITASEAGKATMVYAWSRGYDAMTGAETVSPEAENYEAHAHEEDGVSAAADEIAKAMAAALKWTYDDSWLSNGVIPVEDLTVTVAPNVDDYDNIWGLPAKTISDLVPTLEEFEDRYKDVGVERDLTPPSDYARVDIGSYSVSGGDYSSRYRYSGGSYSGSGSGSGSNSGNSSKATTKTDQIYGWNGPDKIYVEKVDAITSAAPSVNHVTKPTTVNDNKTKTYARRFASGGIVDYTGPAWVDGSKSKPEAFLNPYDTEMIQRMTDALNYIRLTPTINPSADMFNKSEQNFGDINITINQATLENDADIDEVARRVGRAFTKQLSKEGLNLSRYSF